MKHAGNTHLLRVLKGAFYFGRNIDARDGFVENLPCGWMVGHGLGIAGEITQLSLDQLTVAHRIVRISANDREDAIRDGELANGNIEVWGRQLKQRVARGIEGDAQTAAAELSPG